jgi:lactate dehydrogenase-like 2-hydroxyacid dehydrogenase
MKGLTPRPTLVAVLLGVSAGTNIVDLAATRARNIEVTNVPDDATESVAQLS